MFLGAAALSLPLQLRSVLFEEPGPRTEQGLLQPGCATGIPTYFGNRHLRAIISQQTNVSQGFIAYIKHLALHSPNSGPGTSS